MKLFKMVLSMMVLIMVFGFTGCSKDSTYSAVIEWEDDSNYTADNNYYVAIAEGIYSVVTGFENEPLEQVAITAGENETVSFSVNFSGFGSYVIFVYQDMDDSGDYSDGDYVRAYESILEDAGVDAEVTLTPYY